jgi:hypothetical protein
MIQAIEMTEPQIKAMKRNCFDAGVAMSIGVLYLRDDLSRETADSLAAFLEDARLKWHAANEPAA